jgi:nicotinamidase-related amidase
LLDPTNHALILIDHQPQMAFATKSIDIVELRNNVTGLAKSAKVFNLPTILTTVAEKSFSGPLFPELKAVFPEQQPIDRTTMNTWEDKRITDKVNEIGRNKIVSDDAHNMAVQRMVQAGARPVTWLQYLLELQRDWKRTETYEAVTGIAKEHGGGYGLGIIYAKEMFGAKEGQ